ncbi:hypothetical protein P9A30_gp56 [Sphingomonas phage Lucius]|uniref:Uncharacterized protein n=1 Tax=Sphingomonas phage Lucius TaxID=2686313 RepID=A0A6M3T899_9CAUD|nr:hypothetical protein P9A30_gp56 [Sphingomonas phage Lucius]QJD54498.1 hypothetical protein [Sphingomonas phage Lucius]
MVKKLTAGDKSLLATIIAAMANADAPFHMATPAEVKNLLDNGMVETNTEITDGDKVAVRATEKGQAEAPAPSTNEGNTNVTDTNTAPAASAFALIEGAVLPEGRAPRSSSVYPFETMNVGQSFFVPATEDKPNPAKSLASTISSANKRFSKEGADGRKFTVKPVKSGVAYGAFTAPADGALVQRAS